MDVTTYLKCASAAAFERGGDIITQYNDATLGMYCPFNKYRSAINYFNKHAHYIATRAYPGLDLQFDGQGWTDIPVVTDLGHHLMSLDLNMFQRTFQEVFETSSALALLVKRDYKDGMNSYQTAIRCRYCGRFEGDLTTLWPKCKAPKNSLNRVLSACSKCQSVGVVVRYCSVQCQHCDWKMHKMVCGKICSDSTNKPLLQKACGTSHS